MRARGQLALAFAALLTVVGSGIGLERIGPRAFPPASTQVASSGAWFCPHGGGRGWRTDLYVVNPGHEPVEVRINPLAAEHPDIPASFTAEPGTEMRIPVASSDPAASTFIEYFGGWVAAGWVTLAGGGQTGVAAEPCAAGPGTRWLAPDGTTQQGEDASVVVMNPFDVDAVVDVAVYSEKRAPIRDSSFTNVRVPPRRSAILELNQVSLDEPAAAAEVVARTGRVAVASLGISQDGGIRSVEAVRSPTSRALLPGTRDVGQSTLAVMAAGEAEVRFGATLLSEAGSEAAGGLTEVTQAGRSARAYPLITKGPSLVDLRVEDTSSPIAVARRAEGENGDPGATGGALAPAAAWVVLPTVAGEPNVPGVVLGNPGSSEVEVTLTLLGEGGRLDEIVVSVPPTSTAPVPAEFLEREPTASVIAVADRGSFVAAGASTSLGREGMAAYAVAAGVPVPTTVPLGR